MKTILTLVLFLICQVGMGQSYIHTDSVQTIIHSDTTYLQWGTLKFNPPKDTFIQKSRYVWYNDSTWTFIDSTAYYYQMKRLVSSWKAYKQECWNDSTKLIRWIKPDAGNFAVSYPEYLDTVMVHKQPTFEGFMEYLKRRIEE